MLGQEEHVASKTCTVTKKSYIVRVKAKDFKDWEEGKLAQNAFPYLDDEQREFIISGTTPDEWKSWFGGE